MPGPFVVYLAPGSGDRTPAAALAEELAIICLVGIAFYLGYRYATHGTLF